MRRGMAEGVAAAALASAALVVMVTLTMMSGGQRSELIVYQDKYQDVKAGGDWLSCLRCRHADHSCHPSIMQQKGTGGDDQPNACPPHTGMTLVWVQRNGKLQQKWVDKSILKCAHQRAMPPREESEEAQGSGEEEGGEEGAEGEEQVFCVRPAPGERSKWPADQDCVSMKDWMAAQGLYGSEPSEEGSEAEGASEEEAADSAEPAQEESAKTPLQSWYDNKLQTIYDQYYGDSAGGGEGDGEGEEANEEESEEHDACEDVRREALQMAKPPSLEECYGPAQLLCQMSCFSECLRGPSNVNLKARQQMLFFDNSLPIDSMDPTGYDEGFDPPLVVPGGNRDMFGINNQQ